MENINQLSSIGETKLLYLFRNYSDLARQGSKSWLTGRRTRFGGSEIGKVIRNKEKEIIKNKRNLTSIKNLYCSWGNNFEDVAKDYLMHSKKIKIHEFGSVPSSRFPIAYSPDGVFINTDNDLWLLEIKCPFMRNLNSTSKIPEDYISQVQSGMAILPCEKTLFVQFKFRRCYESQLYKTGKYDRWFHKEFISRAKTTTELWHGAMWWDTKDAIRQDISLEAPDQVWYSYSTKVKEEVDKKLTGIFMYFKCFYVKEDIIDRDFNFELWNTTHIWESYKGLMLDYYANKEEKEEKKDD